MIPVDCTGNNRKTGSRRARFFRLLRRFFCCLAGIDLLHHLTILAFQIELTDHEEQTDKHDQRNVDGEGIDAVAHGGGDDFHVADKTSQTVDLTHQRSAQTAGHLAAETGSGGRHIRKFPNQHAHYINFRIHCNTPPTNWAKKPKTLFLFLKL